jgi:hypothetical protein
MNRKTIALLAAALSVLAVALFGARFGAAVEAKAPAPQLTDGAPSIDVLLDRFLHALSTHDGDALRRLRVTEAEYRNIILPGSADAGDPLRVYADRDSEFWWSTLNTKSAYSESNLLQQFTAPSYKIKDVKYRKGIKSYASYKAYKQLDLTVEGDQDDPHELRTGSIAEIDGQYKFISFVRN